MYMCVCADLGMIYGWFREVSRRLQVQSATNAVQTTASHIVLMPRGAAQVNVMSYDYSGYGISEGVPSEEACRADADAALAYLVTVKKIPPGKIILYVAWRHPHCRLLPILTDSVVRADTAGRSVRDRQRTSQPSSRTSHSPSQA